MNSDTRFSVVFLCALCAVTMAFGWGYRGEVGHEAGAMVPGAMLGMALCLGSRRRDWYRRSLVAGLFGAVGWAWGGSFSYAEQVLYTGSDSFPDVLYGYSVLFMLGGLWAGIGGGILGLAFTLPRSALQRFVGPFVVLCVVFLLIPLIGAFHPPLRVALERLTEDSFHDSEWLSALITLIVSSVYWPLRKKDRPATLLFIWGALAWWIGYLGLTKFAGIVLAPPNRSEGWGGVVGILIALLLYLAHRQNRAALMLALYGVVGGGMAFALGVFVHHPFRVSWGPFAFLGGIGQWKWMEESFGFFMGIAIALGVARLLKGGLKPPDEDEPKMRLDISAAFVILVALTWVNLRKAPRAWIHRYHTLPTEPVWGLMPGLWFLLGGLLFTALALYALNQYCHNRLSIVPATAFGKAQLTFLFLIWIPLIGAFVHRQPESGDPTFLVVSMSYWVFATIAVWLVFMEGGKVLQVGIPEGARTLPSDPQWNVGKGYGLAWFLAAALLVAITLSSMALQDGPDWRGRKRFGPDAYWRQELVKEEQR